MVAPVVALLRALRGIRRRGSGRLIVAHFNHGLRGAADVDTLLLVGASRESHLLDYTNERSRFMFNFGDGGAADALLEAEGHVVSG